jgi:hypothetical protein
MAEGTAAAGKAYLFGGSSTHSAGQVAEVSTIPLPGQWYFELDLNTATSWTGEIGLVSCR